jgi:uncharacterized membrane protein YgcG
VSIIAFGLLGAFALVIVVLAVARFRPSLRRSDSDSFAWFAGSDAAASSDSSCDSGGADGGSCDGGGGGH